MKKVGEYWVPAIDVRTLKNRRKTQLYLAGDCHMNVQHLRHAVGELSTIVPESVLRRGTAIDAGANVGAYARYMAGIFDHVLAFEPAADTFACLKRNVEEWGLAGKITVTPCALSDKSESVEIAAKASHSSRKRRIVGPGATPAVTIDSLAVQNPVFLKLDVEGHEKPVLLGAEQTLKAHRPFVLVEIHAHKPSKKDAALAAHEQLLAIGYRLLKKIGSPAKDWLYAPASALACFVCEPLLSEVAWVV